MCFFHIIFLKSPENHHVQFWGPFPRFFLAMCLIIIDFKSSICAKIDPYYLRSRKIKREANSLPHCT